MKPIFFTGFLATATLAATKKDSYSSGYDVKVPEF